MGGQGMNPNHYCSGPRGQGGQGGQGGQHGNYPNTN